jgi:hypothetical protein
MDRRPMPDKSGNQVPAKQIGQVTEIDPVTGLKYLNRKTEREKAMEASAAKEPRMTPTLDDDFSMTAHYYHDD